MDRRGFIAAAVAAGDNKIRLGLIGCSDWATLADNTMVNVGALPDVNAGADLSA
jgi:hypothetical protein